MAKTYKAFRLSDVAIADLAFCLEVAKRRQLSSGFSPASQAEIVEQALSRLARYYRGLKVGKGGGKQKK